MVVCKRSGVCPLWNTFLASCEIWPSPLSKFNARAGRLNQRYCRWSRWTQDVVKRNYLWFVRGGTVASPSAFPVATDRNIANETSECVTQCNNFFFPKSNSNMPFRATPLKRKAGSSKHRDNSAHLAGKYPVPPWSVSMRPRRPLYTRQSFSVVNNTVLHSRRRWSVLKLTLLWKSPLTLWY